MKSIVEHRDIFLFLTKDIQGKLNQHHDKTAEGSISIRSFDIKNPFYGSFRCYYEDLVTITSTILYIESIMYIAQLEEEILLMKNTINEQQQNIDKKVTFIKSLRILIDDKDNKIEQEQKALVQAEINEKKKAEVRAIKKATNEARITAVEQICSMVENHERNTIAQTNLLEQKFKKFVWDWMK